MLAIAVGSPFGLDATVTVGVVSAFAAAHTVTLRDADRDLTRATAEAAAELARLDGRLDAATAERHRSVLSSVKLAVDPGPRSVTVLQRLGPPGALPVKPGGATRPSSISST